MGVGVRLSYGPVPPLLLPWYLDIPGTGNQSCSRSTYSRMYPTLGTGIYWYRGPRGMQYQGVTTSTVTGVSPPYRPPPVPTLPSYHTLP